MQAQTVRINLQYDRADLKQILRYAKAHDVERNGRYDFFGYLRFSTSGLTPGATPVARRNRA